MAAVAQPLGLGDDSDSSDEFNTAEYFRFLPRSKCPINKRHTSATTEALLFITPAQAKAALALLESGYEDSAGSGWGPAERNLAGCVLAKKAANPAKGHVEISPVVEAGQPGIKPQAAHRLVVVAHKSRKDVENMVARYGTSHLCGQSCCINPQHIVVESKSASINRLYCQRRSPTVHLVLGTLTYVVGPRKLCFCAKQKCISMIEKCYAPSLRWLECEDDELSE